MILDSYIQWKYQRFKRGRGRKGCQKKISYKLFPEARKSNKIKYIKNDFGYYWISIFYIESIKQEDKVGNLIL